MVQALSQSQLQALGPQWQLPRVSRYRGKCNTSTVHRLINSSTGGALCRSLRFITLLLKTVSLPMPWFTTVVALSRSCSAPHCDWPDVLHICLGLLYHRYAPFKITKITKGSRTLARPFLHSNIWSGLQLPIRLEWLKSHGCLSSLFDSLWIPLVYKQLLLLIRKCSYKTGDWHVVTGLFISRRKCHSCQLTDVFNQLWYGLIALPAPTTELTLVHSNQVHWLKAQC